MDSNNALLQKDTAKLGIENFRFDILEEIEDLNTLLKRKTYWIELFASSGIELYNTKEVKEKVKYRRQTFFLTEKLIRAIGVKAALERRDKSEIVRAALQEYIEDRYYIIE